MIALAACDALGNGGARSQDVECAQARMLTGAGATYFNFGDSSRHFPKTAQGEQQTSFLGDQSSGWQTTKTLKMTITADERDDLSHRMAPNTDRLRMPLVGHLLAPGEQRIEPSKRSAGARRCRRAHRVASHCACWRRARTPAYYNWQPLYNEFILSAQPTNISSQFNGNNSRRKFHSGLDLRLQVKSSSLIQWKSGPQKLLDLGLVAKHRLAPT